MKHSTKFLCATQHEIWQFLNAKFSKSELWEIFTSFRNSKSSSRRRLERIHKTENDIKAGTIQLIRPRGVKSHYLLALTMFSDGVADQKISQPKLLSFFCVGLENCKIKLMCGHRTRRLHDLTKHGFVKISQKKCASCPKMYIFLMKIRRILNNWAATVWRIAAQKRTNGGLALYRIQLALWCLL